MNQTKNEAAMRKSSATRSAGVLSLIMLAAVMSAAPTLAQTDSKTVLVQDFKAFEERCKPAAPQPPAPLSPLCANELAALTKRQHDLHLTDADLEAAGVRGGFRGGFR